MPSALLASSTFKKHIDNHACNFMWLLGQPQPAHAHDAWRPCAPPRNSEAQSHVAFQDNWTADALDDQSSLPNIGAQLCAVHREKRGQMMLG